MLLNFGLRAGEDDGGGYAERAGAAASTMDADAHFYHIASFTYVFRHGPSDVVYFAYSPPYTVSRLFRVLRVSYRAYVVSPLMSL